MFVCGLKDYGEFVVKWGNDSCLVCWIVYDLLVKVSYCKVMFY